MGPSCNACVGDEEEGLALNLVFPDVLFIVFFWIFSYLMADG